MSNGSKIEQDYRLGGSYRLGLSESIVLFNLAPITIVLIGGLDLGDRSV
jgi:hypothetical protein